MGRSKIIAIALIAVSTLLSIIYLIYQSKELEKYTSAAMDENNIFIIYSRSNVELMDKNSSERLLEACETSIESFGYETIIAEGNKDDIEKLMKGNKRYIVLEINVVKTLPAKHTLIMKLSTSDREKYKESINNAARIKSAMKNSSTKISIQADDKQMSNHDIGDVFFRFEISNQNTLEEAQNMIVGAAYALTLESSGN